MKKKKIHAQSDECFGNQSLNINSIAPDLESAFPSICSYVALEKNKDFFNIMTEAYGTTKSQQEMN